MMEELENIDNVEDVQSHLSFKLDGFEGPLDLLLHLIKEKNVSIQEYYSQIKSPNPTFLHLRFLLQ